MRVSSLSAGNRQWCIKRCACVWNKQWFMRHSEWKMSWSIGSSSEDGKTCSSIPPCSTSAICSRHQCVLISAGDVSLCSCYGWDETRKLFPNFSGDLDDSEKFFLLLFLPQERAAWRYVKHILGQILWVFSQGFRTSGTYDILNVLQQKEKAKIRVMMYQCGNLP